MPMNTHLPQRASVCLCAIPFQRWHSSGMCHSHSQFCLPSYHFNFPFSSSPLDLRPAMSRLRLRLRCIHSRIGSQNPEPEARSPHKMMVSPQEFHVNLQVSHSITLHPVHRKANNPGRIIPYEYQKIHIGVCVYIYII